MIHRCWELIHCCGTTVCHQTWFTTWRHRIWISICRHFCRKPIASCFRYNYGSARSKEIYYVIECARNCYLQNDKQLTFTIGNTHFLITNSLASSDRCYLPQSVGRCRGTLYKYYFNHEKQQCDEFLYGGCLGNDNRFNSVEECQQICVIPQQQGKCRSFKSNQREQSVACCLRASKPFWFFRLYFSVMKVRYQGFSSLRLHRVWRFLVRLSTH